MRNWKWNHRNQREREKIKGKIEGIAYKLKKDIKDKIKEMETHPLNLDFLKILKKPRRKARKMCSQSTANPQRCEMRVWVASYRCHRTGEKHHLCHHLCSLSLEPTPKSLCGFFTLEVEGMEMEAMAMAMAWKLERSIAARGM